MRGAPLAAIVRYLIGGQERPKNTFVSHELPLSRGFARRPVNRPSLVYTGKRGNAS